MQITSILTALITISSITSSEAFAFGPTMHTKQQTAQTPIQTMRRTSKTNGVFALQAEYKVNEVVKETDDDITRLKSMAAKLRAEASQLEAQQTQTKADVAQRAFAKFDVNNDGMVSVSELKAGLEKTFKLELSDERATQLMQSFDASGDSALQLDEFVTTDQFRNRLDALVRDEKRQAREAAKEAKEEEENAQLLQSRLDLVNDKEPTNKEKAIACLPYLFPLLDSLQYASVWVNGHPDNVIGQLLATLYGAYLSIPFGGFIAFFALSTLSSNLQLNRLVRFNMQQAIYLDIALIVPALLAGAYTFLASSIGTELLPPQFIEAGYDAAFVAILATITYSIGSSALGKIPDKLPFISKAVGERTPTSDEVIAMIDRFENRQENREDGNGNSDGKSQ